MKRMVMVILGLSLLGLTACSSQKAGEAQGNMLNVQTEDSQTKIDQNGKVSVKTDDAEVNVDQGNISVQGDGTSVNIKDGKIQIEGLDKYLKDTDSKE